MVISSRIAREVLQGRRKLAVWGWGSKRDFTVFEWQRQVAAEFMVEDDRAQWKGKNFHGLPVFSPKRIEKLDPATSLILNNAYFTPAGRAIAAHIKRLGYRGSPPLHLHEMAALAAKKPGASLAKRKDFVEYVNGALAYIVTPPAELQKHRPLPDLHELTEFFGAYSAEDYLKHALPRLREQHARSYQSRDGHVCLLIGVLHPGGAERQLCNLAVGLKWAGWTPTVLIYQAGAAETLHYRAFLEDNGVRYEMIMPPEKDPVRDALGILEGVPADVMPALWHMRGEFVLRTALTYKTLRRLKPELLISYLEWPNVFAGMGGAMAGVPHIVMSGRMLAPIHFPHFFGEFTQSFRDIYRLAITQPGVSFNNNSRAGAKSYAKWLGVPERRIPVVPSCVTQEFTSVIAAKPVAAWRKRLGLKKGQPLILGVFRLSAEKRPLDFVRVIAALHRRVPELRAVICGQAGNQEKDTRALIRKLKLDSVITLAGVTEEIPAAMKAATLLLHVSKAEGAANVILEAQAMGLPVVCTKFEGNLEFLHRGWLPYARKPGDILGLSAACARLIDEPKLCKKIATKARAEVRKRHSLSRLTRETLQRGGIKP